MEWEGEEVEEMANKSESMSERHGYTACKDGIQYQYKIK